MFQLTQNSRMSRSVVPMSRYCETKCCQSRSSVSPVQEASFTALAMERSHLSIRSGLNWNMFLWAEQTNTLKPFPDNLDPRLPAKLAAEKSKLEMQRLQKHASPPACAQKHWTTFRRPENKRRGQFMCNGYSCPRCLPMQGLARACQEGGALFCFCEGWVAD